MHAQAHQLIALRDKEPMDAVIREHVESCALCRGRLHQFANLQQCLSRLPVEAPPPEAWQRICERRFLETTVGRPARRKAGAVAAVLTAIALVTAINLLPFMGGTEKGAQEGILTADASTSLRALQARSRELEYALREQHPGTVVSMHTAGTISELEDSIALIDYELGAISENERQRELWQQRVELMQMLIMVRSAERYYSSI